MVVKLILSLKVDCLPWGKCPNLAQPGRKADVFKINGDDDGDDDDDELRDNKNWRD